MKLLEKLPESATAEEIDTLFPWAGARPNPTVHLGKLLKGLSPGDFCLRQKEIPEPSVSTACAEG